MQTVGISVWTGSCNWVQYVCPSVHSFTLLPISKPNVIQWQCEYVKPTQITRVVWTYWNAFVTIKQIVFREISVRIYRGVLHAREIDWALDDVAYAH